MKHANPSFWVNFTKIRKYNSKLFQIPIFSVKLWESFKSQTWKQLSDILRGVPYEFKGWKALVRINGNHLSASLSRCNHHNMVFLHTKLLVSYLPAFFFHTLSKAHVKVYAYKRHSLFLYEFGFTLFLKDVQLIFELWSYQVKSLPDNRRGQLLSSLGRNKHFWGTF